MTVLRSSIYYVALAVTVFLFGILLLLLGWRLPVERLDRLSTQWGRVNLWLLKLICGLDFEIRGAEHLPADGPCIVMAKHQSAWETLALRGILPPMQSWVLKQELMKIPVFGSAMRRVKPIPIDRKAGRRAVLQVVREGVERLEEKRIVIIFPEGTRTSPGERKKYGLGGGLLAERSGIDVIPIAHNAGVYWARRGVKKHPGTIQVVVGKPIPSKGRKAAEIMGDVENWIENTLQTMPSRVNSKK